MAQHDYVIANANGATVRADINNALLAISSTNSGSSEPSTPYAYEMWVDTSNNLLKLRNAANDGWITLGVSITASNTVDINGGAIDGTPIGASSASTGAFSTLSTTDNLSIGGSNKELRFYEGSNYVGFEAPALTGDQIWVLPSADGSADQVMTTDGSGNLSWATAAGTTINSNADNRVITGSGTANTLNAEASLTWDGTTFGADGGAVFNDSGADADFRIESDTLTHAFVVDGATGDVFLGQSSQTGYVFAQKLVVGDGDANDGITIQSGSTHQGNLAFNHSDGTTAYGRILYQHDSNYMAFMTNNAERMRIRASGGVGIGTAGYDSQILAVNSGSADTVLYGESTDANCFASFRDNSSTANIEFGAIGNDHVFRNDTTEKMRIDSDGNVGIGTTDPGYNLVVNSTGNSILQIKSGDTSWASLYFGEQSSAYRGVIQYNNSTDHMEFYTTGSERMRIDSSGKILAGTTTNTYGANLVLNNTSGELGLDVTDGTTHVGTWATGALGAIGTRSNHDLILKTNDAEVMRIGPTGSVGIGTATLTTVLNVQGSSTSDIFTMRSGSTANSNVGNIIFRDGGADFCGQITSNGSSNTVAYNTSSDARLKNVLGEAKGLEIINQLNPVHFEWKKSGLKQDGLIAQEVEPIIPNAVTHNEESDVYSMDYSKLVTPLIKAVQELTEKVEALESA